LRSFFDSKGRLFRQSDHDLGEWNSVAYKRPWWATHNFKIIDAFRPWWVSLGRLPPREKPIHTGKTLTFFILLAAAGVVIATVCVFEHEDLHQPHEVGSAGLDRCCVRTVTCQAAAGCQPVHIRPNLYGRS
jgi:hypothetical protein